MKNANTILHFLFFTFIPVTGYILLGVYVYFNSHYMPIDVWVYTLNEVYRWRLRVYSYRGIGMWVIPSEIFLLVSILLVILKIPTNVKIAASQVITFLSQDRELLR